MARPLIAFDADGVLLDFHLGYAGAWARAFGVAPTRARSARLLADRPLAGRAAGRRAARPLPAPLRRRVLVLGAGDQGALDACQRLHDAGFDLVCVSALEAEHEAARLRNLRYHGFPIERVFATGNADGERSPKADAIAALAPEAFVDDYLPYMRGLPPRRSTRRSSCAHRTAARTSAPNSRRPLGAPGSPELRRLLAVSLTGSLRASVLQDGERLRPDRVARRARALRRCLASLRCRRPRSPRRRNRCSCSAGCRTAGSGCRRIDESPPQPGSGRYAAKRRFAPGTSACGRSRDGATRP